MTPHIPTATYRIQMRDGVDFDRVTQLLPYLSGLGVSHLYLSPIFQASTGSTHGYDIIDPTRIDPALGGREGFDRLARAARAGVRVRILTNSQAATDVMVVHSAYVNYRPALLRAGVSLLELRPGYAADDEPEQSRGLSRASLHSKALAIDGKRVFIGSFNFDPRSVMLNTEMGVLIDSPRLARALADAFATDFPRRSYVPVLGDGSRLAWNEIRRDGSLIRHDTEPGTTFLSRLAVRVLGRLPIEWLL